MPDQLPNLPTKTVRTTDVRTPGGGPVERFGKAYRKARDWHCAPLLSFWVALRFAVTGDSGLFHSHGGWRVSRIRRQD